MYNYQIMQSKVESFENAKKRMTRYLKLAIQGELTATDKANWNGLIAGLNSDFNVIGHLGETMNNDINNQ